MPERGSLKVGRHWIYYVRGGTMTTVRSPSRDMVSDLIKNVGGVAGLNGTFFSDARVSTVSSIGRLRGPLGLSTLSPNLLSACSSGPQA